MPSRYVVALFLGCVVPLYPLSKETTSNKTYLVSLLIFIIQILMGVVRICQWNCRIIHACKVILHPISVVDLYLAAIVIAVGGDGCAAAIAILLSRDCSIIYATTGTFGYILQRSLCARSKLS